VSIPQSSTQGLHRSIRVCYEPEIYRFLILTHGNALLVENNEPNTYEEAMSNIDSRKWLDAIKFEMDSMYTNQIWNLVDPPEGIKPNGCNLVFIKKTNMEGNVQMYKVRLVGKVFIQRQGVDYDKTFSPMAMIKFIQILLAITAYHDYEIWKIDVKTAFLNSNLV